MGDDFRMWPFRYECIRADAMHRFPGINQT
jgi:hypothetical protein